MGKGGCFSYKENARRMLQWSILIFRPIRPRTTVLESFAQRIDRDRQIHFFGNAHGVAASESCQICYRVLYAYVGNVTKAASPGAYHIAPEAPTERRKLAQSARSFISLSGHDRVRQI